MGWPQYVGQPIKVVLLLGGSQQTIIRLGIRFTYKIKTRGTLVERALVKTQPWPFLWFFVQLAVIHYSKHPLPQSNALENPNFGSIEIQTRGHWVRSANTSSVLCHPRPFLWLKMALPPLIGIANVQTVEVISHVIQFKPISRMLPNRKKSSKNMLGGGKKSLKVSRA